MTNQELIELIEKTITTQHLSGGGKMQEAQADKFLDYVFDETQLNGLGIRTVKFRNEEMTIEKINVADRVAVAADEAADPRIRRGVSTSKISLKPVEIMVPFEIGDLFKQRNIEGDTAENHIIKMMATRFANNVEELFFHGNLLGPAVVESSLIEGGSAVNVRKDRYLGLFDGLLKLAEGGHVVDAQNGQLTPKLVSKGFRALPNKFRKDKRALRVLTSPDHDQYYAEGLSGRGTMIGDDALSGRALNTPFGVPMQPIGLVPSDPLYVENSVANTDGTTETALSHAPIDDVIIAPTTLEQVALAPYVEGVDYSLDKAAGTWTRLTGGTIGSGATVKVTYRSAGKALITKPQNIIVAIGKDISIEKDRNIYKRVTEYAMYGQVFVTFEELDAVSLIKNLEIPV